MRQSRGLLLPPISGARLRRGDIYRVLRAALLDGVLPAGARLPSTRQAAVDYGVSRGTLEEVFSQLTEEGFFERGVGRGTFVAASVGRINLPRRRKAAAHRSPVTALRGREMAENAGCREPEASVPFNAGIADTSGFPWNTWRQLQARAVRELGREALIFSDPRGLPNLRAAIARYLVQFRGIRCEPGQIVIFNSAQQALNALAVLLLDPGDRIWIEDPCYLGARAAFQLAGAAIVPVPVDDQGIRVEDAVRRSSRARLVYTTPSHQYPTGATLSLERRIALLDWASRNDAWIIEDDYDGEFRSDGQMLTALCSLDAHERVLYVGTLNKAMFVSLRLAYVVLPESFVELAANVRTQFDGFTPATQQMAMSLFMDEGHFSAHLRRMRSVYKAKRAALTEGLAPLAARGWTWRNNAAGMHLLVRHARGDYVRATAAASRLDVALLSRYRASRSADDGLFLRFGALDAETLQRGTRALVAAAALKR